jgi:protein-tyrosine phosphatase
VVASAPIVRGLVDLHCHWVAGIDDGARSSADSAAMLQGLAAIGFEHVVATPHMRPGMFDNRRADLVAAYERTNEALESFEGLPARSLASEHFFDDVVFQRLVEGPAQSLPYRGGKSILVEIPTTSFPLHLAHRFADLSRAGVRPVLAHPERYEPVWDDPTRLDPLIDAGAVLLLDVAALAGKYGRKPRRAAETLVEQGYYHAACSDAHRASDVEEVAAGIERLVRLAGAEEAEFLLGEGPRGILDGTMD